jgi:predicted RNA binding protein YcfA (HicA-like mRNA interferase family)
VDAFQKLIIKIINEPRKVTESECERLLVTLGYKEKKKPGSERVFHKSGSWPITIPTPKKGKYVKSPYIKLMIKYTELEQYLEGE